MYHPVTTEYDHIGLKIKTVVDAAIESGRNFITVYPNNDLGSEVIMNEYKRIEGNPHFRLFPSLRFEYFLTFLKNADFILGNSSAGIRESGIYGVPAIDIGTRQNGRYSTAKNTNLQHVTEDKREILEALEKTENYRTSSFLFGDGNSTQKFMRIVRESGFWAMEIQKHFIDRDM